LITVERARLLQGPIGRLELPDDPHEAMKLTRFVGRDERVNSRPIWR
jgi:hypothetical protein